MKSNKYFCSLILCCLFLATLFSASVADLVVPEGPQERIFQEQGISQDPQEKISLDLKNVEIVELLRIISLKTGKTIIPDMKISGRMTLYVNNVTFEDILDIIALSQDFGIMKIDNVYYVVPGQYYRSRYGLTYKSQRQLKAIKLAYAEPKKIFTAVSALTQEKVIVDEASGTIFLRDDPSVIAVLEKVIKELDQPLPTKIFDLNYAKAADAKTQLTAAVTPGTGVVVIDERSGKAIVSDLPGKMKNLTTLVRELDEESRQVYIEADIVELTLSDKFERGIDWEKVYSSGAMDGLAFAGFFPATLTAAYQKISVGTLASNKYTAVLNFLNTYGKTNIISQPRIAVINNEEANIMVGVREAYITQTQSQATSTTVTSETVEFVDVGVKLKVVPRIGADGFITMKLKPEVSSVKETIETALGSRIPIVQTSQSETVVKVKDGMMIMIAGMTKIENTDSIKGWPVLSKLPILGTFFGIRTKEVKRTEVIIFLTPHLSRGDAGLRGNAITEILPMEYLSEDLQKKVVRDNVIDKGLFYPEKLKDELAKKQALEIAAQETSERAADIAAKKDAGKTAKAAALKAEKAAKKASKEAQKAAEALEKKIKAMDMETEKAVKAGGKATAAARAAEKVTLQKEKPMLKDTAKDYYQKGLRAKADSDNAEAIRNFISATELDKKYAAAYNSLGVIYEQEGKLSKAEEMYMKAVEVDERYCPAYSNLALFNEERKDFIKALEYWRKRVLYGDPNNEWTKQALQRVKELEG